uniref:Dehydrogenase/reductase SDR family member 7B n=1 Tax=Marmota marmota marmota TaxID=9994 RepID=A0A8C6ESV2_MARMA
METNCFGPIALTKALLPSKIKRSISFQSAYGASKHATQAFFDCLHAEMEQDEIQVTVISLGYIYTNLFANAITTDGSRYGQLCSACSLKTQLPLKISLYQNILLYSQ